MAKFCQVRQWAHERDHFGDLLAAVQKSRRDWPDAKLAVSTGWSSPKTLFDDSKTDALRAFITQQLPKSTAYIISAWANVMQYGDTVTRHDHKRSHLGGYNVFAGCYYLMAGASHSALIVYAEPTLVIRAKVGTLVVFSADCEHSVEKQLSHGSRLSIAFNVKAA